MVSRPKQNPKGVVTGRAGSGVRLGRWRAQPPWVPVSETHTILAVQKGAVRLNMVARLGHHKPHEGKGEEVGHAA